MKFSERYGFKAVKDQIQKDKIDRDLKNSLWNTIFITYLNPNRLKNEKSYSDWLWDLSKKLWFDFLKNNIGGLKMKPYEFVNQLYNYYQDASWFEIYDLIEFIAQNYPNEKSNESFIKSCNFYLKRELSAYRFVGNKISPITSEEEIVEIEEVLKSDDVFKPVNKHIELALNLLSDKKAPDYKNSIKESISAIESMCKLITQNRKVTLGEALKIIANEGKIILHPSLKAAFEKLYGYTSDANGIRHGSGLMDESNLDFEDAKFMLVACSAFINYLKEKVNKVNLKIKNLD